MGLDAGSMAEAGSGMLSRLLKPSLLLREPCELGMSLSGVSRLKCSRLSGGGGGGDLAEMPVGREVGAGDWVAMTGISPDADVGVEIVRLDCVSPLEPELRSVECTLLFAEPFKEILFCVDVCAGRWLMTESREPSRLSALGAGGAKYDFRLCLSIIDTAHSSRLTGVRSAA